MLMAMALLASMPAGRATRSVDIFNQPSFRVGGLTRANAPLINPENLFSQPGPALVALLIETLPIGAALKDFAPKGGTAISLFVRDLPRFVDIDLSSSAGGIAGRDRCGHEKNGCRHWQGNSRR
ncbi:hypothetical protein ACVWXQ_000468 [Bradyrhizobium sp. S3.14.4]